MSAFRRDAVLSQRGNDPGHCGVLGAGIFNIVIATTQAARGLVLCMIRGIVIRFMDKNDIRFARVAGCTGYIIRKHLIMGAFEIAVLAMLDTGAIIQTSALSFLGLNQPPTAEWGHDAEQAKNVMTTNPGQMLALTPFFWWWQPLTLGIWH